MDDVIDVITGMFCEVTGSIRQEQRVERRVRAT